MVTGLVCILIGLLRIGFVTELLSKPIRYGYMNGIALTVLISQVPKMFGFKIESDGPLRNIWAIIQAILNGQTNWTEFGIGAGTLAVILLLKRFKRVPGILIAVVGATLVVGMFDLAATANVSVLGPLPQGHDQQEADRQEYDNRGQESRRARLPLGPFPGALARRHGPRRDGAAAEKAAQVFREAGRTRVAPPRVLLQAAEANGLQVARDAGPQP